MFSFEIPVVVVALSLSHYSCRAGLHCWARSSGDLSYFCCLEKKNKETVLCWHLTFGRKPVSAMDYLQPHRQLQAEGQVTHGSLTGTEEQGRGASEVNFFMVMRRDVLPMYNKV